jgi:hypothetical protein
VVVSTVVSVSSWERTINNHVLIDTYYTIYNDHLPPLLWDAPDVDPKSPWLSESRQLYISALLILGAQAMGHSDYETQFLTSTRVQLDSVVASQVQPDPFAVATYGLLSRYYNSTGALDTAYEMIRVACAMAEELNNKHRRTQAQTPPELWTPYYDGVDIVELHVTLLEDRLEYLDPVYGSRNSSSLFRV